MTRWRYCRRANVTEAEARNFLSKLVEKYVSDTVLRDELLRELRRADLPRVPAKGVLAELQKHYKGSFTPDEADKLNDVIFFFV